VRVFNQMRQWRAHWIWSDIVVPFLVTRFALLLIGWFSQYFPCNPDYPGTIAIARGWHFSPLRMLDIWGRWDTGWYMSIVNHGYTVQGNLQNTQSNIAFFPLYPCIVKFLVGFIPAQLHSPGCILFIGVIVSNLLLFGALIFLHKLISSLFHDDAIARRTVFYLLIFPTSFFLSCFYTESTFLFLSVTTFYAAHKRLWWLASVLGGLLVLSRPLGVMIIAPLVWLYLESLSWKLSKIDWNIAYLLLIPVSFSGFLLYLYPLTSNLLAPIQIQAAWGRGFAMPWITLLHPIGFVAYLTPLDRITVIGFLVSGVASFRFLHSPSYGLYSFLLLLPPLFSGTLMSSLRFCVVVFPLFIVIAFLGKRWEINQFFTITFLVFQILFMTAWCQFYWIG
jgi:hypothetical protein